MPYIFLLLFSLFLTSCTNNGTNSPTVPPAVSSTTTTQPSVRPTTTVSTEVTTPTETLPVGLPATVQTTDIDDLKIAPENTIVGSYILKRGAFSHGAIYQDIDEGYLVIEELEVNNYGYYYVTIVGKITPETHSGIFYEKGGKFVQKVIYDDGDPEQKTQSQSHIAIIDNIDITYDDNILKIVIDSTKKETTIWERDDGVSTKSPKMEKALQHAKQEYLEFYKNKCINDNVKCADRAYTPVNN